MDTENELLKVDKAITDEEYSTAKDILLNLLAEVPESGIAHNHVAWLYHRKFSDMEKAEMHYKFAIKFSPKYSVAYLNYIYMLRDFGRIADLERVLLEAEKISNINRSSLYDEFGSLYEMKEDFERAIENYKKAITFTLNNEVIEDLKKHIKRCRDKKDFLRGNRIYKALKVLINRE